MKQWLSIAILLALCVTSMAQVNVQLRGHGDNLAGKTVELYCYEDMLTMEEHLLDVCNADSSGHFELACYLTYPRLVFVQVECYSQSFFAEPGRTYEVYLPEFRWEQNEERNIYLDPVALPLQFLNLPPDELNLRILRFDNAVDSFLSAERVHFDPKFKPSRAWMDSLELAVTAADSGHEENRSASDFYKRYTTFTLAEMRYAMRFASRQAMMSRFIEGQPILYHDENYMRLLFSLLDGMVSLGTRKLPKWQLAEWVAMGALDVYLDSLGTDPLLHDEQLRELAALVALKESYYDADYDRAGVHHMVQQLGERSKFADHRTLASRLEHSFHRAEQGSTMPPIALPDTAGHLVNLDSLAGRWIYIAFVRVTDPPSLRELETMAFYRDSVYSRFDSVVFVGISCDRDPRLLHTLLQGGRRGIRYDWLWLHFDGDYRLLERYGVVDYPTFILINPEGQLHYSITPAPASGILMHGPWTPPEQPKPKELPFIIPE